MNRRKFLVNALTFSATPAALRALETPLTGISNANPFVGLGPKRAMALEESNLARDDTEINALLAGGPFFNLIGTHCTIIRTPTGFVKAKFRHLLPLGPGDCGQLILAWRRRVVRQNQMYKDGSSRIRSTTRRP